MTDDIDDEALATHAYLAIHAGMDAAQIARAVVAAYQQQLAERGYLIIQERDIKAFFAAMDLPPFSFERLIGMTT